MKRKKVIKAIHKIVFTVFVVLFMVWIPGIKKEYASGLTNCQNVLSIWHIETFEGGSFSRERFLDKLTVSYEKKNAGKLFLVKTLTVEQAQIKIQNNELPDMVSFGTGAGYLFVDYVKEYSGKTLFREDLLECCKIKNNICAVPYMLGGYVKISKSNFENVTVASNTQNGEINIENVIKKEITPYQLYEGFIDGKHDTILGTQRDFVRVENRINNGKFANCNYEYLSGFNNLIQYFCITANNETNVKECSKFIEFATGRSEQEKINQINMFSACDFSIYATGKFKDFEKEVLKPIISLNAFCMG